LSIKAIFAKHPSIFNIDRDLLKINRHLLDSSAITPGAHELQGTCWGSPAAGVRPASYKASRVEATLPTRKFIVRFSVFRFPSLFVVQFDPLIDFQID